jgi:hypothetical protein
MMRRRQGCEATSYFEVSALLERQISCSGKELPKGSGTDLLQPASTSSYRNGKRRVNPRLPEY